MLNWNAQKIIFSGLRQADFSCATETIFRAEEMIQKTRMPACEYSKYPNRYDSEREFCVWQRYKRFPIIEGVTVIFGHTTTKHYCFDTPMCIWHGNGWIGIDCGCAYPEGGDPWSGYEGRLGCLRLDDMKEFYSEDDESPTADYARLIMYCG